MAISDVDSIFRGHKTAVHDLPHSWIISSERHLLHFVSNMHHFLYRLCWLLRRLHQGHNLSLVQWQNVRVVCDLLLDHRIVQILAQCLEEEPGEE